MVEPRADEGVARTTKDIVCVPGRVVVFRYRVEEKKAAAGALKTRKHNRKESDGTGSKSERANEPKCIHERPQANIFEPSCWNVLRVQKCEDCSQRGEKECRFLIGVSDAFPNIAMGIVGEFRVAVGHDRPGPPCRGFIDRRRQFRPMLWPEAA